MILLTCPFKIVRYFKLTWVSLVNPTALPSRCPSLALPCRAVALGAFALLLPCRQYLLALPCPGCESCICNSLAFFLGPWPTLELFTRLRLLITSVLRLIGCAQPCSLRKRPQALQSTDPISFIRREELPEHLETFGKTRPFSSI
jgi:hypothetical protein